MPTVQSFNPLKMALLIIIGALLAGSATAAVPFAFSVSPTSAEVAAGSTQAYDVTITASPGFSDTIHFTMTVSAMGYTDTLDIGTYSGPYPRSFTYNLQVPPQIPGGVAAKVTITGSSGSDQFSQTLDLNVKGEGGPLEGIISAITSAINSLLKALGLG